MKNYQIIFEDKLYKVLEIPTQAIIKSFKLKNDAREYMNFLKLGGGFDGWTPNFLLKTQKKSSISK